MVIQAFGDTLNSTSIEDGDCIAIQKESVTSAVMVMTHLNSVRWALMCTKTIQSTDRSLKRVMIYEYISIEIVKYTKLVDFYLIFDE